MRYVIIDTETSGLFDFSKPADAPGQPRLASLAMILVRDDLTEEHAHTFLVKPDGWEMPEEAIKINGLTKETLAAGWPVADVLKQYISTVSAGHVVVAFNSQYDTKIMRGELRRAGLDDLFDRTPNICVMRALTDICRIPKAKGNGFKFPKLSEACAHFGFPQDAAHSAMGDARSALDLFRKLHELRRCPAPAVHFAKCT